MFIFTLTFLCFILTSILSLIAKLIKANFIKHVNILELYYWENDTLGILTQFVMGENNRHL